MWQFATSLAEECNEISPQNNAYDPSQKKPVSPSINKDGRAFIEQLTV
jgi:hypothetical protein